MSTLRAKGTPVINVPIDMSHGIFYGRITVVTSGTRVQGPDVYNEAGFHLRAMPANTGIVFVGNNAVTTANGFPMSAGNSFIVSVDNLNQLFFDASAASQVIAWFKE